MSETFQKRPTTVRKRDNIVVQPYPTISAALLGTVLQFFVHSFVAGRENLQGTSYLDLRT
jgi:hypothetical protein